MSKFNIRDKNGILKATVDARIMAAITSSGGAWRPYKTSDKQSVCYEYHENMHFSLEPFGIGLDLSLWEGDKVIPC